MINVINSEGEVSEMTNNDKILIAEHIRKKLREGRDSVEQACVLASHNGFILPEDIKDTIITQIEVATHLLREDQLLPAPRIIQGAEVERFYTNRKKIQNIIRSVA